MILVVDSSVTVSWIAPDEDGVYADNVRVACGEDRPVVTALWHLEMANTLLTLERRRRLPNALAALAALLRDVPVTVDTTYAPAARSRAELELAKRHGLSVYDASYLAAALACGAPLATLDVALAKAAKAEGVFFNG